MQFEMLFTAINCIGLNGLGTVRIDAIQREKLKNNKLINMTLVVFCSSYLVIFPATLLTFYQSGSHNYCDFDRNKVTYSSCRTHEAVFAAVTRRKLTWFGHVTRTSQHPRKDHRKPMNPSLL